MNQYRFSTRPWAAHWAAMAIVFLLNTGLRAQTTTPPAPDSSAPATQPAASTPEQAKAARAELADRFESMALEEMQVKKTIPPTWREMDALLNAASRMNPTESRFLRLLVEARLAGNQPDEAVAALQAYLTLNPRDEYAEAKLIDLYVSRMQTADAILSYMRGIMGKSALSGPVRAHAAVVCAQALRDHAQPREALKVLETALKIEPLNRAALRMKYDLTRDQGASHRCGLLLQLIRADPADPDTATVLANELADLGLVEPAAFWYQQAAELYNITGQPRSPELARGAATELYLFGHAEDADKVIAGYLKSIPYDTDAWQIRLAIVQDLGKKEGDYPDLVAQAVNGATQELQNIRAHFGAPNAGPAATQPAAGSVPEGALFSDSSAAPASTTQASTLPTSRPAARTVLATVPDLSGDLTLLVNANQSQLTDTYLEAVGNLAWMRLYFLRDAGSGTQALIDELGRLVPADDMLLARLNGWSYLVRQQWDQARLKLSAVADRDPYAALGMVLLYERAGEKDEAKSLARGVMARHPSGAVAAVLFSALRHKGASVEKAPRSDLVEAAINKFPTQWVQIASEPTAFYTVTFEPLTQEIAFTQSILARITIENTSDFDITMGEDSTLHPDLVFDANARGMVEKQMPGIIYDRFWQRLLLPKGQSASQVVRLDRGELYTFLQSQPNLPIDLQFAVTTNSIRGQKGYAVGAAGYSAPMTELVERASLPLDSSDDRKKLYDMATNASPVIRLRAVETLANFGQNLRQAALKAGPDNAQTASDQMQLSQEVFEHARPLAFDPDHCVRAWADYMSASVAPTDALPAVIQHMALSDDWYERLLSLLAAERLPDHGLVAASALTLDPDPAVKEYASAMGDYYAAEAAAEATTQPAQ